MCKFVALAYLRVGRNLPWTPVVDVWPSPHFFENCWGFARLCDPQGCARINKFRQIPQYTDMFWRNHAHPAKGAHHASEARSFHFVIGVDARGDSFRFRPRRCCLRRLIPTISRRRSANASAKDPVRMKLQVQLAEPGDKIDDPSIAWPDSRKTVELGVVEIDKVDPDSDAAQRALLFLENAVPAGIETADPMIDIRSQAYAVSFARRHATAAQ